jgi:hypothetical protein
MLSRHAQHYDHKLIVHKDFIAINQMDITAIEKEIHEEEKKVRESLQPIESLKSLLSREEQASNTNNQLSSGPDTTVPLPTSLKYDNKILSAFVIHSE